VPEVTGKAERTPAPRRAVGGRPGSVTVSLWKAWLHRLRLAVHENWKNSLTLAAVGRGEQKPRGKGDAVGSTYQFSSNLARLARTHVVSMLSLLCLCGVYAVPFWLPHVSCFLSTAAVVSSFCKLS
jgi:hypothetical protein